MPHAAPSIAWAFHHGTAHRRVQADARAVQSPMPAASPRFAEPYQMKEYPSALRRRLPPPDAVNLPLGEAIRQRGSCRRFSQAPLPLACLSTLLRYGYGLGDAYRIDAWETFERPVPSGGGCYPLELYLFARRVEGLEEGSYHYCVREHALELLGPAPSLRTVEELFLGQPWLGDAQVLVLVTAIPNRVLHRYSERGYRYLLIEAGHLGQNLSLVASASSCASLCLGGFLDDEVAKVLGLDSALELPLYGVALGVPETTSRLEARALDRVLAFAHGLEPARR